MWKVIRCAAVALSTLGLLEKIDVAEGTDVAASFSEAVAPFARPLAEVVGGLTGAAFGGGSGGGDSLLAALPATAAALSACHDKETVGKVVGPCEVARFIAAVQAAAAHAAAFQHTDRRSADRAAHGPRFLPLDSVSATTPYSQLFVDFVVPGTPVQLLPPPPPSSAEGGGGGGEEAAAAAAAAAAALRTALEGCTAAAAIEKTQGSAPLSRALRSLRGAPLDQACPEALPAVRVPSLALNDYLVRLTPDAIAGHDNATTAAAAAAGAAAGALGGGGGGGGGGNSPRGSVSRFSVPPAVLQLGPSQGAGRGGGGGGREEGKTAAAAAAAEEEDEEDERGDGDGDGAGDGAGDAKWWLGGLCGGTHLGRHALLHVVRGSFLLAVAAAPAHAQSNATATHAAAALATAAGSSSGSSSGGSLRFGASAEELLDLAYLVDQGGGQGGGQGGETTSSSVLSEGTVVLLPHGTVAGLRGGNAGGENAGDGEGGGTALLHCFVDASNLNAARAGAAVAGLVHPPLRPLAAALASRFLDTAMLRTPLPNEAGRPHAWPTWVEHNQWPRSTAAAEDDASGAAAGGRRSKRVRKTQAEWQADTKWKWRVAGLTLPVLQAPTVVAGSVRRSSCTLQWRSPLTVPRGDATPWGYNVTWYLDGGGVSAGGGGLSSSPPLAGGGTGGLSVPHERVESGHAYDHVHKHALVLTLPAGSLLPGRAYAFAVGVYYGEASSPPSPPSSPLTHTPPRGPPGRMHTAPTLLLLDDDGQAASAAKAEVAVAADGHGGSGGGSGGGGLGIGVGAAGTSLTLAVLPPLDDGGSPIVGYVVEARHHASQAHVHTEWEVLGSHLASSSHGGGSSGGGLVAVTVEHLLPHCAYQFRLSAYNALGLSPEPGTPSGLIAAGDWETKQTADGGGGGGSSRHHGRLHGHGARTIPTHHFSDDTLAEAEAEAAAAAGGGNSSGGSAHVVAKHLAALHSPHAWAIAHGPMVELDDANQRLAFASSPSSPSSSPSSPSSSLGAQGANRATAVSKRALDASIEVWSGHWSPQSFNVRAELVVADPPDAASALTNAPAVRNRIVLVERGGVPLVDKVLRAQKAGALAVLITDTGECGGFDQLCSPGSDKGRGEGFARHDLPGAWAPVRVPAALLLRADADRLLAAFDGFEG